GTAVGEVQHPQHRELQVRDVGSAERAVEAAASELRFAEGLEVAVAPVAVDELDDLADHAQRFGEAVGADERKVVGGGVVLGKLSVTATHQRTDRQAEARASELAP